MLIAPMKSALSFAVFISVGFAKKCKDFVNFHAKDDLTSLLFVFIEYIELVYLALSFPVKRC